jgi:hypothetical protein
MMHVKPGINININNWRRGFTAICFVFLCRLASGDLVKPMSAWSASKYFILIFVWYPSSEFMEVLVGNMFTDGFCCDLYRGYVKISSTYPGGKYLQVSVCSDEVRIEVQHFSHRQKIFQSPDLPHDHWHLSSNLLKSKNKQRNEPQFSSVDRSVDGTVVRG